MKKILAFLLVLSLSIAQFTFPAYADTPAVKGFTMDINIGGVTYPCTVELGDWVTFGQTTDLSYSGMAVCFGLYFLGGDGQWYPVKDGELIGSPSDYADVEVTATKGAAALGQGTWKHDWADSAYYYEIPVLNKEASAIDLSVSACLKDTEGVGNPHDFTGTVQKGWTSVPINIGGVVYDCWTDLTAPVTSSGSENIPNKGTVCFPLAFYSGGNFYPVVSNELQGTPDQFYDVAFECSDNIAVKSWKWSTWPSNQYFVEAVVENKNAAESAYTISCTLTDKTTGVKSTKDTLSGTIGASLISMPISLGGVVYDMEVSYDTVQILPGPETIPNSLIARYYIKFTTNGTDSYNVREGELQGIPTDFVELKNTYEDNPLYTVSDPVIGKLHYDEFGDFFYVDYVISGKTTSAYDFSFGAYMQQYNKTTAVQTAAGSALGNRITAPINIGGVVYTCDVDISGYLTSTGNNTLNSGATICLPLMFLGGDGIYYPVYSNELQGTPAELGLAPAVITDGSGYVLSDPVWKTWDNNHYFAEYVITNVSNETADVKITANLSQEGVLGQPVVFEGTVTPEITPSVTDAKAQAMVGNTITNVLYLKTMGSMSNVFGEYKIGERTVKADPVKITEGEMAGYYSFTLTDIYSQNMSDIITFKLLQQDGENVKEIYVFDETNNFSIASYCDTLAENCTDKAFLTLLANMLEYGAASQKYINYNTENLANGSSWVSDNKASYDFEEAKLIVNEPLKSGKPYITAATLSLKNQVSLCVYVKAQNTENVKLTISGKNNREVIFTDPDVVSLGNNEYMIFISELLPYEYDTMFNLSLAENEDVVNSVTYGVNVYLNNKKTDSNEKLAELVSAINNFEYASKAFLK